MSVVRSIALFVVAALFEIGGAWLVWQGVREHRGWAWIGAGIVALATYGFVATLQPDGEFGRVLAAYGGVFVAGSIVWGMVADGYRPDRWDVTGALVCLAGMAVIMYAPATTDGAPAYPGPVPISCPRSPPWPHPPSPSSPERAAASVPRPPGSWRPPVTASW